jgi:outer membrane protein assembly factor BamB
VLGTYSRTLLIPIFGLATALTLPASGASGRSAERSDAPVPVAQQPAAPGRAAPGQGDWPQWRGVNRDGVVAAFNEPKAWPEQLTLKWKVDAGLGYAAPIVVGNRVYLFERREPDEVLRALDAESGKTVWESKYPAPFKPNPAATSKHGTGPKSTPTFANGKLYTLGMSGIVTASDAASGKQVWQKPAPPVEPMYHTAMSPLVDRGLVIVHVGGHNQGALTAFDPDTGAVKWTWTGDGPAYGSPIVTDIGGTRQVVVFTQENLVGVDEASGALLWKRPFTTRSTQNTITPLIYGGNLIVSGLEKGVTSFKVLKRDNQWTTENIWENQDVSLYMTNAVIVGDTLFGMSHRNSGQFFALDARTGKTLWTSPPRQATNTAISHAGDLLFMLKDDGELIIAKASTTDFEPLKRYTVADSATWAAPTVAGNRIYVKDTSSLALWTW